MISFSPTFKCQFCQHPAQKVCAHPDCKFYPFVCINNIECPLANKNNKSYGLHNHGDKSIILQLTDFRSKIKLINTRLSQTHLEEAMKWERKIRSKISQLINTHVETLTQKYPPKLVLSIQKILRKAQKPSNYPDLYGFQIDRLISQKEIFNQQDQNYKTNQQLQKRFIQFTQLIQQSINTFLQKYQEKLQSSIQIPILIEQSKSKNVQSLQQSKKKQLKSYDEHLQTIQLSIKQAENLFKKHKYQSAIEILQKQIKKGNQNYEIYLKLGEYSFVKANNFETYDKSIKYYDKSYQIFKNSEALNGKGTVLTYKHNDSGKEKYLIQALACYEQAINYNKKAIYFFNRGSCYHKLQKFALAVTNYTESINMQCSKAEKAASLFYRGKCYVALNQQQKGKNDQIQAYRLDPQTQQYYEAYQDYMKQDKKNSQKYKIK